MKETIEELFRMFKVEPNEALIKALIVYVQHECLNAQHEMVLKTMDVVDKAIRKE